MNVAIFGLGFIGKNLLDSLLKEDCGISVLSRHKCPSCYEDTPVKWIQGDFNNLNNVDKTLKGVNIVYHLISTSVPGDAVNVAKDLHENVFNTINLLDLCIKNNVQRFIFASSSSVYGNQDTTPIDESCLPNPISYYAAQKISLEYYINLYAQQYGLDCKILRISNPYGPGQNIYGRQGFIAIALGKIINNETILIRGNGKVVRDYIYISDVVNYLVGLLYVKTHETLFNVGSGVGYSLNEVINEMSSIFNKKIKCKYVESREIDIATSILNINKLDIILKSKELIILNSGIKKFLSFLSSEK